jgi:hypothetical protein
MPAKKNQVFVGGAILLIFIIGYNFFFKIHETHSLGALINKNPPTRESESLKIAETNILSPVAKKIQNFDDSASSKESHFTHEIPFGAIPPAVLMDHGSAEDSLQVTEMLISMEQEFFNELASMQSSGIPIHEIWEQLRTKYDERYIGLFGQDAFLEATSLAAEEAREDYKTVP